MDLEPAHPPNTHMQEDAAEAATGGAWAQSTIFAFRFLFVVVALLAIGWAISNCREIAPENRALVLRFGSVAREQGAGLLLAWPRPIEQVVVVPAADRQIQLRISRLDDPIQLVQSGKPPAFAVSTNPRYNAGFLLTGDTGVVHLEANLFFQVTDPVAYFIAGEHLKPALERLFVASAIAVAAGRDLSTILVTQAADTTLGDTTGTKGSPPLATGEQFRADLVHAVNHRLSALATEGAGLGVTATRVDVSTALPSNVKADFDQILAVTQIAEQNIALARTYAEQTTQGAVRQSRTIMTDAEAAAAERRSTALARTAVIDTISRQASQPSGDALLNKIYYDRIGPLLARARQVDTVDQKGGARMLLPGTGP
jgi:regulator of protease activity HflC (stomatin/prohibitin superfamily)